MNYKDLPDPQIPMPKGAKKPAQEQLLLPKVFMSPQADAMLNELLATGLYGVSKSCVVERLLCRQLTAEMSMLEQAGLREDAMQIHIENMKP